MNNTTKNIDFQGLNFLLPPNLPVRNGSRPGGAAQKPGTPFGRQESPVNPLEYNKYYSLLCFSCNHR